MMEHSITDVDNEIATIISTRNVTRDKPLSPILNSGGLGMSRRHLIRKKTKNKKTRVNLCERFRNEIIQNQNSIESNNIALLKTNCLSLAQVSERTSIEDLDELERIRRQFYNLITIDKDFNFKMPTSPVPKARKITQQVESTDRNIINVNSDIVDFQQNAYLRMNTTTVHNNSKNGFQTAAGKTVHIPSDQIQKQLHLFDDILHVGKTTAKRNNKFNFLSKPQDLQNCTFMNNTHSKPNQVSNAIDSNDEMRMCGQMPDISDTQLITEADRIFVNNNLGIITQISKCKNVTEQCYGFSYDEKAKSCEMHRMFLKSYHDLLRSQTQVKSDFIDIDNPQKRKLENIHLPDNKRLRVEFDLDRKLHVSGSNTVLNSISKGFATASGKFLAVSEKSLASANKIFNEVCLDLHPLKDNKIESLPNHVPRENQQKNSEDNDQTRGITGFSTASKKCINISEKSLKNANKIFKEIDSGSDFNCFDKMPNKMSTGFSTASKKCINVSEGSLRNADQIFKAINAESTLNRLETVVSKEYVSHNSLKTAAESSKKFSAHQATKIEKHSSLAAEFPLESSLNGCNIRGFSTGSGTIIKVSENSLKRACKIFDEIKSELDNCKDPLSATKTNSRKNKVSDDSEFSVVSGVLSFTPIKDNTMVKSISIHTDHDVASENTLTTSESSTYNNNTISDSAHIAVNNRIVDENHVGVGGVNQPTVNGSQGATIAQRVSRNKLKLLDAAIRKIETFNGDDYSDREDLLRKEAIKKMANKKALTSPTGQGLVKPQKHYVLNTESSAKLLPSISSKSSKRRLGISSCQQIQISEEKLQRAKLLLSEDFPELSPIKPPVRTNFSSHSSGINSSTPIANRSLRLPMEKVLVESETPTKASFSSAINESLIIPRRCTRNLSIVFTEPNKGSVSDWSVNMKEECEKLERKLNVLRQRNEQLCILREKSELEKRPKQGVLSMKKSLKDRIILRSLNLKENSEARKVPVITPQNAEKVHFREVSPFLVTEDGATIIPNAEDLIGVSEIEHGFKLMPGIDPALIPNGWVKNHYRLIIWKVASYERNLADQLEGNLTVENVVQQLKYRYDREIDKAERSALRRIYEKDDAPQKRMILCVSNIILDKLELQLTDGWYFIKTLIDEPLRNQIVSGRITLGTKLVISGAELINCDGCNPLEAADTVYLKINYNCTRRALWYTKLGYQHCPGPFPIRIETVHPIGGPIGLLKLLVVRFYPIKYLERFPNKTTVWRNAKAEERSSQSWENEQCKQIEKLQEDARDKIDKISYSYNKDSECLRQEIMSNLQEGIKKLKSISRNVSSVLRLLVVDALGQHWRVHNFLIWNPTEFHLQSLKEGTTFAVSNVLPRANGDLYSGNKTTFTCPRQTKKLPSCFERKTTPIEELDEIKFVKNFQEFDCVGIVLKINIESNHQLVWLCGTKGSLLIVRVTDGPDTCSLFDNLKRGSVVTACNLIYKRRKHCVHEAIANHNSVFSYYPQHKHLQTGLEEFKACCPKDLNDLYKDCDEKIENYAQGHATSVKGDSVLSCYDSDEDMLSMSRITSTDVALSLIDMDKFI